MTEAERAMNIAENTNYLNKDIQYLRNVKITEWDIQSAGFSVIKFRKLLPDDMIERWEKLDKKVRTIREGKLQRQKPIIGEEIINTLKKVRKAFTMMNALEPRNILSIKKDAIFVINKPIKNTVIKDYFTFRNKGSYTSYIYINKKEFYFDSVRNILDVKGFSDENFKLFDDIRMILRSAEKLDADQLYNILKKYRQQYLRRELPLETYKELDSGKFRVNGYLFDAVDEHVRMDIDISQNYLTYILPLFNIML